MKRIILNIALLLTAVIGFTACEPITTAGVSKVTKYVIVTLEGDEYIVLNLGDPFIEPGYHAEEGGQDVTDKVKISPIDTNKEGIQIITYTAKNADGFQAGASRTVVVIDNTDPMCGFFESKITRNRAGVIANRGPFEIYIKKGDQPGEYIIDDFLGGWYNYGSDYGPDYAAVGIFKLNPDNTMTLIDSYVKAWKDRLTDLTVTSFDPLTGSLKFTSHYGGMTFAITATKIQL